MRTSLTAVFAACVGVAAGQARQGSSTSQQPGRELPVHTVRIDAIAVDARGAAVGNLRPADFEVREDGKPVPLDEARFVRIDAADRADGPQPVGLADTERQEARRANSRLVAIFLDEYHISAGPVADRAREALGRFLDQALGPRDLVVVMKPLDSLYAIRLTHDRVEARRIVDGLEGRKGDYTPRKAYERDNWAGTPARIETARTQVAISALGALAVHLGTLSEARKTLLVVTEGLVQPSRRRGQEYLATLDSVIRAANRANVSIYPVDPRPSSSAGSPADEQAALRSLANDTDGETLVASGNLAPLLQRAVADISSYYLLTYRSAHREDGGLHRVTVSVKNAGIVVRARGGYWAPSADDRLRALALARATTLPPPVEPVHVSPLIRPWFGWSRGSSGKTRVTFVWEPAGRVPGDRVAAVPARLELTALTPDNAVLFEGPVLATGPGRGASEGETPARVVFEVAPGPLRLRMRIEDAARQSLDFDAREIVVRDLSKAVTIGTAAVMRARNAREFRALDADAAAAPVASREFSRTERLLIRFPAYSPDGLPPRVAARLLTRAGQAMRALDVVEPSSGVYRLDLPLAGLAPGEYLVELTAAGAAGQAKDLVSFRVTN